MDELLDGCGLTRTNIIYSGGGHCYLLLPNTAAVQQTLADWNRAFNGWLNEQFGVQLFPGQRLDPLQCQRPVQCPRRGKPLQGPVPPGQRHCRAAQAAPLRCRCAPRPEPCAGHPRRYPGVQGVRQFRTGQRRGSLPVVQSVCQPVGADPEPVDLSGPQHARPGAFALPGIRGSKRFLSFSNDSALCADAVRSYTKNRLVRTLSPSVNLFVGDYAASNNIEDLADQSEGIRRIAVCRMDVDNLGQAFIAGFEQPDQTDPVQRMKYVNLFRAAAFSRQMSLFFKYHINGLLQGLCVSIVYAGGDDVFLVGAWNHTLQAALRIQKHLAQLHLRGTDHQRGHRTVQ